MFEFIAVSLGGGGSSKIPDPKPLPVAPTEVLPAEKKAASDIKERLKRARGRAASRGQQGFGVLDTAGIGLASSLGGGIS